MYTMEIPLHECIKISPSANPKLEEMAERIDFE
jgi:hypothetical protein